MARSYSISEIIQSGGLGVPGRIKLSPVAGDVTASFQGKFFRNETGDVQPWYSTQGPDYTLIKATTFDVVSNASYSGRYSVYSMADINDAYYPSTFDGSTTITVNEIIGPPALEGDSFTGTIKNISTYFIQVQGETPLVVPPGVSVLNRPLDILGRNVSPWAETFNQNFIALTQNFAAAEAPSEPFLGQSWYNSGTKQLNIWNGTAWASFGVANVGMNETFRFTQSTASDTWVITHNLNLQAPYVCLMQAFVDRGVDGFKAILPSDTVYSSANSLTVTFSNPETGIILIKA